MCLSFAYYIEKLNVSIHIGMGQYVNHIFLIRGGVVDIKPNKPKKKLRTDDIEIIFVNKPSANIWTKYRESVISANIEEHIPAHLQKLLLSEFVEAGLMAM